MLKFGRTIFHRLVTLVLLLCATAPFARAQTAADGTGDTPFKTYVRSANAARDAGNIDAALQNYREALKMDATWQEGWWNLGTLLYERDRYADAIPAFQTLAGLAPQASPAWTFLGLCEFETKDYANALEHLFKGEALGGVEDAEIARVAKYHLGLLLIRAGEFDRAHAVLAGLASAGQSSPQITFALGLGLLRVPLLPEEVDPSREALVLDTGGVAAQVAAGDGPGALTAFQTAIAKYPDAPYLHYAYGEALAADGKLEDALGEFRRELGISPQSALPQVEIARVELGLKRANEALLAAQEAVRRAPDSHAAHEVLAQCFAATGARREAAKELMAAETLGGEKPSMEERIVERYRTNVAERGTSRQGVAGGDDLFDAAMRDYSAKQYSEAIAGLKIWLQQNANSGTGWAVLGLSEFALHDYDNALIHLQRGQQLGLTGSPDSVGLAKYRLGILLNHSGQFNAAEQLLMSATVSEPLTSEARFALGMALLHLSEFPDQVPSSRHDLVEAAGEIAERLKESKYDLAFSRLDDLLRKYPSAPFLHYTYGTALTSLSQYDEAAEQFRAEILLSPSSELPYLGIASLELKRHRPANALGPALHAVHLAPRDATAHYLVGRSYLETGKPAEAIGELQEASTMTPGSPEVHFSLAKAYAKTNQSEKAEEERTIFAQLNALAEQQRSQHGDQSYGSHDAPNAAISNMDHAAIENSKPQ